MTEYIIKTKKQENGLWGVPTTVTYYKGLPKNFENHITVTYYKGIPKNFENHIIESAVLISLYENGTIPESVYSFGNGFKISFSSGNTANYNYENYMVVDNTLYIFTDKKEKIIFQRKMKIKNILC
jgi:hypothetical protein